VEGGRGGIVLGREEIIQNIKYVFIIIMMIKIQKIFLV
jgi:seryl-tRNA(Sec) selenium transferase